MPRVSKDAIEKLNAFIAALPEEAKSKCALCNETLVHLVKMAEVETGVGTATVTRALAEDINKTASPGERVSGEALVQRVRQREGLNDSIIRNPNNKNIIQLKRPHQDMKEVFPLSVMSEDFKKCFDNFFNQVLIAKKYNWETTSFRAASQCIKSLNQLIGD